MAVPAAVWAVVVLVPVVTALVLGCGLLLGGSARQQPLRTPLNADGVAASRGRWTVVLLAALGGVESPQFENIELWAVLRALCSVLPVLLVPVLVPPGSPRGDVGAAAAPSGAP